MIGLCGSVMCHLCIRICPHAFALAVVMARSGHLAGWGSEQGAKRCLGALRVDEAGGVCNEVQ